MFDFDIDEIKRDLEGLSIQEQLLEIQGLRDDLDMALSELEDLETELNNEYESSVLAPLLASVKLFIQEKGWDELVTMERHMLTEEFVVSSKPHKVRVGTACFMGTWSIHIVLADFIASNAKRIKAHEDLAAMLNHPYLGASEIAFPVEEDELEATMLEIITKLCEKADSDHTECSEKAEDVNPIAIDFDKLDPLFIDAARFIVEKNLTSTAALQRQYGLGYNRACRIMEQLESTGIIDPAIGSKPRKILVDEKTLERMLKP
ncbi:MAG: hypothetical protein IKR71_08225 [Bacteroidales bacterium]|nr:hypothetical protein [Bacteroidales bacterium]